MLRLRLVLVLIGFTAVTAQIVLMRELLVLFSGAEISLGLMLASWLLWTAAGSGILGRYTPAIRNALLATLDILIALALPLTILAARVAKGRSADGARRDGGSRRDAGRLARRARPVLRRFRLAVLRREPPVRLGSERRRPPKRRVRSTCSKPPAPARVASSPASSSSATSMQSRSRSSSRS